MSVINTFPFILFFIPYYGLAIMASFGHVASLHNKKIKNTILGLSPTGQSKLILYFGLVITALIFFGLTNHFKGVDIPEEYNVMIGE